MSAEINQAKHKLAKALLVKFSFLFPLPKETNVDAFVAIWRKAIEDLDEALVLKAADNVLLTMTRFPYPADLRAEVKALQAVADVKPINTGFPDTAIELIREERLRARELYCKDKQDKALGVKPDRKGWDNIIPANDWAVRSQLNLKKENLDHHEKAIYQFHQSTQTSRKTTQPPQNSHVDNPLSKRFRHKLIRSVRKARCRSLARNELPQKSGVIAEIDFSMLCDECVQWALLEGTPISHFDLLQTILTSHAHQVEIALRATRLGRIRLKIASILLRVAGRAQCI